MGKRSIIYVDGFNLYYGALRGSSHKWLDLERYFTLLRADDEIQAIRYFTALVTGPKRARQDVYLKALDTSPLVEVILGKFKMKQLTCRVTACSHGGSRRFQATEEKRTDVNIGVHLLDDAYQGLCDRVVLVTGDSDLVPAVNRLKLRFPAMQVVVYVPSRNPVRGAAVELRAVADKDRTLPLALLPKAQFAATISDGAGGTLTRPAGW